MRQVALLALLSVFSSSCLESVRLAPAGLLSSEAPGIGAEPGRIPRQFDAGMTFISPSSKVGEGDLYVRSGAATEIRWLVCDEEKNCTETSPDATERSADQSDPGVFRTSLNFLFPREGVQDQDFCLTDAPVSQVLAQSQSVAIASNVLGFAKEEQVRPWTIPQQAEGKRYRISGIAQNVVGQQFQAVSQCFTIDDSKPVIPQNADTSAKIVVQETDVTDSSKPPVTVTMSLVPLEWVGVDLLSPIRAACMVIVPQLKSDGTAKMPEDPREDDGCWTEGNELQPNPSVRLSDRFTRKLVYKKPLGIIDSDWTALLYVKDQAGNISSAVRRDFSLKFGASVQVKQILISQGSPVKKVSLESNQLSEQPSDYFIQAVISKSNAIDHETKPYVVEYSFDEENFFEIPLSTGSCTSQLTGEPGDSAVCLVWRTTSEMIKTLKDRPFKVRLTYQNKEGQKFPGVSQPFNTGKFLPLIGNTAVNVPGFMRGAVLQTDLMNCPNYPNLPDYARGAVVNPGLLAVDNSGEHTVIYILDYNKGVLRFDFGTGEVKIWVPRLDFIGASKPGVIGGGVDCSKVDCGYVKNPVAIALDHSPKRRLLILQERVISRVNVDQDSNGKKAYRLETIAGGCEGLGCKGSELGDALKLSSVSFGSLGWCGHQTLFEATPSGAIFMNWGGEDWKANSDKNTSRKVAVLVPYPDNPEKFYVRLVGKASSEPNQWLSFSGKGAVQGCEEDWDRVGGAMKADLCPYCNANCWSGTESSLISESLPVVGGKPSYGIGVPGLHWAAVDRLPASAQEYRLFWQVYSADGSPTNRYKTMFVTSNTGNGARLAASVDKVLWRAPDTGTGIGAPIFFTSRKGVLHVISQSGILRLNPRVSYIGDTKTQPQWTPILGKVSEVKSGLKRFVGGDPGECSDGQLWSECRPALNSATVDETGTLYFLDRGRLKTLVATPDGNKVRTVLGEALSTSGTLDSGLTARFVGIDMLHAVAKEAPMSGGVESLVFGDLATGNISRSRLDGTNQVLRYAGNDQVGWWPSTGPLGESDPSVWRAPVATEKNLLKAITGEDWENDTQTLIINSNKPDSVSMSEAVRRGYTVDRNSGDLYFTTGWSRLSLVRLVAPQIKTASEITEPFFMRLLGSNKWLGEPGRELFALRG